MDDVGRLEKSTRRYLLTTFLLSMMTGLSISVGASVASRGALTEGELFYIASAITLLSSAFFWCLRFVSTRIADNRHLARSIGSQKVQAKHSFERMVDAHYGPALAKNILAYEDFWSGIFQNDLNRHSIATGIVLFSSILSIIVGIGIITFQNRDATWLTALGSAFPALVTATSLKIWLETRKNLNATSAQVDSILCQRLRMIIFWDEKEVTVNALNFSEHLNSCKELLNYINSTPSTTPDLQVAALVGAPTGATAEAPKDITLVP